MPAHHGRPAYWQFAARLSCTARALSSHPASFFGVQLHRWGRYTHTHTHTIMLTLTNVHRITTPADAPQACSISRGFSGSHLGFGGNAAAWSDQDGSGLASASTRVIAAGTSLLVPHRLARKAASSATLLSLGRWTPLPEAGRRTPAMLTPTKATRLHN